MKRQNYVPTSLGQYLNENKAITLTRKYGQKEPVVVGSRAPLRDQVLNFVSENQKVSRVSLKRFIAGLNETSKNPNAAANMWLTRNARFFIAEEKGGVTTYKLSKLGMKLLERTAAITEASLNEEKAMKKRGNKSHDFVDKKTGDKGVLSEEEDDEEMNETSREKRVQALVEQIRAKRKKRLFEADDEDEDDEGGEEAAEDVVTPDDESEEEKEEEDDDESAEHEEGESEEEEDAEEAEGDDDDRVEITEFIISVDDVEEAIAELAELGIDAQLADEDMGDDELDMGDEDFDMGDEGGEEIEDFDLDMAGDIEGEMDDANDSPEEETIEGPDMEESVTGMDSFQKKMTKDHGRVTPNLVEDEDEFSMEDIDVEDGDEEVDDFSMEEEPAKGEGEDDLDMGDEAPVGGEKQIKVSAENWEALKGWLEGKGVDIEDMFGGEIEVEGAEGDVEDEISFDGLEDTGEEEGGEEGGEEAAEAEEGEEEGDDSGGEEEEVEESDKGDKKKGGFQPGKKGVNPFPKK